MSEATKLTVFLASIAVALFSCQGQKPQVVKIDAPTQTQEEFDQELEYLNKFPVVAYTPSEDSFEGIPAKSFSPDWTKILIFSDTNVNADQKAYFEKYDLHLSADIELGDSKEKSKIVVGCFESEKGDLGSFVASIESVDGKSIVVAKQILTKPYLLFLHPKDGIYQLDYKFENHPLQIISGATGRIVFEEVEI